MKQIMFLALLIYCVNVHAADPCHCPHVKAFRESGWIIHNEKDFYRILDEKLQEFIPEIGGDLVLDVAESYISDFSHDCYLIMWVVIWDRVSTVRDEMWGDIAFSMTGPASEEYTELRWYDPKTRKRHIVCNPDYAFCLTTKAPLAYNTIF